eukprot:7088048-Prymnesium_polylepis.1
MRAEGRQTALPMHTLQPPPPCVLSPDPVTTPGPVARGALSPGDACEGGARPHCPALRPPP